MYVSVCVYVCVHVDRVYVYSSMSNIIIITPDLLVTGLSNFPMKQKYKRVSMMSPKQHSVCLVFWYNMSLQQTSLEVSYLMPSHSGMRRRIV